MPYPRGLGNSPFHERRCRERLRRSGPRGGKEMRRRSRLCVLACLMGGMSLLVLAAPPASADKAVGGDSIAVASASGGSGGSVFIDVDPLAITGDSGVAVAQS